MIAGPLAGDQESGAPRPSSGPSRLSTGLLQHLGHHPGRKLLPATAAACSTARPSSDSWVSR